MLHRMKSQHTVLVINSDINVLVLMKRILENDCRVLLAADAESAIRLMQIKGVRVDLAVIDGNVLSRRRSGLVRRMTDILPQLRILFMAGSVEDGVIRLQALTTSKPTNLLESIRLTLSAGGASRNPKAICRRSTSGQRHALAARVIPFVAKTMVAGQAID